MKKILSAIYVYVIFPLLVISGFYGIFVFIESPTIQRVFNQIFDFIFR